MHVGGRDGNRKAVSSPITHLYMYIKVVWIPRKAETRTEHGLLGMNQTACVLSVCFQEIKIYLILIFPLAPNDKKVGKQEMKLR